jgi:hemolysin activation/secretion protein
MQRRQEEQLRQEGSRTRPTPGVGAPRLPPTPNESPCLQVHSMQLEGPFANHFEWLQDDFALFQGRCLGNQSIQALLNNLNAHIQDQGYVTSRADIEPQPVDNGTLVVKINAGLIKGIRMGKDRDKPAPDAVPLVMRTAIPTSPGRLLNVRDLDQGADNVQGLAGYSLTQFIVPSNLNDDKAGQSDVEPPDHDLVLQWIPGRHWQASIGFDNSLSPSMGRTRAFSQISLINPLNLADQLRLHVSSNAEAPGTNRRVTSSYLQYSVPLGYHRLGWSQSISRSGLGVRGTSVDFISRRYDKEQQLQWGWTLFRDGHFKIGTEMTWGEREGNSHIEDSELVNQRRNARTRSLGLSVSWVGDGLSIQTSLSRTDIYRQWVGDEYLFLQDEPTKTSAIKLDGQAWLALPWYQLQYSLSWQAQTTQGLSALSDTISLGGRYSVRGFTGDHPLVGYSGALLRQEMLLPATPWPCNNCTLAPYLTMDMGRVWGTGAPSGSPWLAGAGIGARFSWSSLHVDLSVSTPLQRSGIPQGPTWVPYLSAQHAF